MIKIIIISTLAIVATLVLVQGKNDHDEKHVFDSEYEAFLNKKHPDGKHKKWSKLEAEDREAHFKKFKDHVDAHNARKDITYTLEVNQFSDQTDEEKAKITMTDPSLAEPHHESRALPVAINTTALSSPPPAALDYSGKFTTVLDQKNCGSCWVFSTLSMLEAFYRITVGNFLNSFSHQYFVSCDLRPTGYDLGCSGGWPSNLLKWIQNQNFLVPNTASYGAYTSGDTSLNGTCKTTGLTKIAAKFSRINSFTPSATQPTNMVAYTKQLLAAYGPMTIAVQIVSTCTDFFGYKSGVYVNKCGCGSNCNLVNHAMVLVGYGKDTALNKEYWIIRNSWGPTWGENGYIRYAIDPANKCGELCNLMGVEK